MPKQPQKSTSAPPLCNLEAEQYVLSACLTRPEIIPQVGAVLSLSDFYREAHSSIFRGILELGKFADHISLCDWLKKHGELEKIGGEKYLTELIESPGMSAGWRFHADLVKDLASRRQVVDACMVTMESIRGIDSLDTILGEHKSTIRGIGVANGHREMTPADLCKEVFREIEQRHESGNPFVGIKTGLENIDTRCWGLEPSTTIYLIARPSIGKTALALQIADYVSANYESVIFYSLESSAKALTRRRLAYTSGVSLTSLRTARMDDNEWRGLIGSIDRVGGNQKLIIQDNPKFKQVERLAGNALSIALERKVSLIVVDHIQRMTGAAKSQSRHLEISHVSEELSTLSHELKIPILILCQLSRWIEKEKVKRPQLSAMKESGDLEANADGVWSLYRETKESELAWVDCLKGRDTGTWTTKLLFKRDIQRFFDTTDREEEEEPQERRVDLY